MADEDRDDGVYQGYVRSLPDGRATVVMDDGVRFIEYQDRIASTALRIAERKSPGRYSSVRLRE